MNNNEIKNQLYKSYSKELEEADISKRDFFNLPLDMAVTTISSILESKGLECPPDVYAHIKDGSISSQHTSGSIDSSTISDDASFQMAIQNSKEEFNRQQNSYNDMKPLNLPTFDISKFRYLKTDESTAQERNISCEELLEYRKSLTKGLAAFDSIVGIRYRDSIKEESKKINDQPKNGIIVSILLHTGDRINKIFDSEDTGSSIYYWTAAEDKMIKDNIKPGHFIIIKNTGDEINPDEPIKDQILEKQILLNVRLL